MIKELINEIKEAENTAEKNILSAQAEAAKITLNYETQAEAAKSEARARIREYSKKVLSEAAVKADKSVNEILSKAEADGEACLKAAAKKADAAQKIIIDKVLSQWR